MKINITWIFLIIVAWCIYATLQLFEKRAFLSDSTHLNSRLVVLTDSISKIKTREVLILNKVDSLNEVINALERNNKILVISYEKEIDYIRSLSTDSIAIKIANRYGGVSYSRR